AQVFPEYSRFEAGDSLTALTFKGRRISTPICYETVIPELVREMVANNHAELIISVANDSWFGMSKEPYIHLAMAKLRAIEHRRWFVRATNGGISAVINPAGRVVNNVPLGEEGVRASIVDWRSEQTLYTLYGNWFVSVVMGLTLLTLLTRGAIFRVKKSSELDFKQRASLTK
ncbi:nitrilase-related carbon-nitrogen hydrolase, partial [Oleiphilus sp. HI0125]